MSAAHKPGRIWTTPSPPSSQVVLVVKNPPANAGDIRDAGSIPGSGRFPGGGHGNPLQYSCLENPMDRGAWGATVDGVAKCWTRLKRLSVHASLTLSIYPSNCTHCARSGNAAAKSTPSMLELLKAKILLGLLTQEKRPSLLWDLTKITEGSGSRWEVPPFPVRYCDHVVINHSAVFSPKRGPGRWVWGKSHPSPPISNQTIRLKFSLFSRKGKTKSKNLSSILLQLLISFLSFMATLGRILCAGCLHFLTSHSLH